MNKHPVLVAVRQTKYYTAYTKGEQLLKYDWTDNWSTPARSPILSVACARNDTFGI